jgi:phosphoribosylformimino-5-aminoimidazole carboxamide ribonucleotide (ProFAR) isomerase
MKILKITLSIAFLALSASIFAQDTQVPSAPAMTIEEQATQNGYNIARACGIKDRREVSDILELSIDYYISRSMEINRSSEMQDKLRNDFERDMQKLLNHEQKEKFKQWMTKNEVATK